MVQVALFVRLEAKAGKEKPRKVLAGASSCMSSAAKAGEAGGSEAAASKPANMNDLIRMAFSP